MAALIPFKEARWYQKVDGDRPKRVIVIHDMEAPEKPGTAEAVAAMFANLPSTRKASAHINVDNDSEVRSVQDNDVAYAAPGANHDGLHIEHAGFASQTNAQWLDEYGQAMLKRSAKITAAWAVKYNIQVKHLTNDQLRHGETGFVGHRQVSAVYKQSTHTDPGTNFPWSWYMALVANEVDRLKRKPTIHVADIKKSAQVEPGKPNVTLHPRQVKILSDMLIKEGLLAKRYSTGHFSYPKKRAYKAWQVNIGATKAQADGIPGAVSLKKLGDKYGVRVVA